MKERKLLLHPPKTNTFHFCVPAVTNAIKLDIICSFFQLAVEAVRVHLLRLSWLPIHSFMCSLLSVQVLWFMDRTWS